MKFTFVLLSLLLLFFLATRRTIPLGFKEKSVCLMEIVVLVGTIVSLKGVIDNWLIRTIVGYSFVVLADVGCIFIERQQKKRR